MRRSPRRQLQEETRPPVGPALPPQPRTPHHERSGAALDQLVDSIEQKWHLGLPRGRSQLRSPALVSKTLAERTYGKIKQLFYSNRPTLDEIIEDFTRAAGRHPPAARLQLLDDLLRPHVSTPHRLLKSGTPVTKNEPPKTLLVNSSTSNTSPRRSRDPELLHETANEGGSTTEEDEPDVETPPSPTPSSRRKQASPHSITSNPRKRPSDSSAGDRTSTKLTRTTKGKQTATTHYYSGPQAIKPPEFKKPTIEMARSFQPVTAATSAKTSFTATTSANTSFNASISSSQQTTADTVNTSFTSYDGVAEKETEPSRTSSTAMGSLDSEDLFHIARRLESQVAAPAYGWSQDGTRESTSRYGSIDELELMATEASHEASREVKAAVKVPSAKPASSPTTGRGRSPLKASSSARLRLGRSGPQLDGPASDQSPDNKSPKKIPHYIRDMPTQNLFVPPLSPELHGFPYHVLFACCRISEASGISTQDLLKGLDTRDVQSDENKFWAKLEAHAGVAKISLREPEAFWLASRSSFEGFSFKGRLIFNSEFAEPPYVFKLDLLPAQAETSCQLQRQFGSDRFLYLTIPSLHSNRPSRFREDAMPSIRKYFDLWLAETHSFLGRQWRVLHIQPVKRKNEASKDDTADLRLVLFAISGIGIHRPLPLGRFLNEFIPLVDNQTQNFCKALARLDLGFSKTTPTRAFKPSQIRRIKDTSSDGTPEATEFDDPALSWTEKARGCQVMNDGCARMSVGAALLIWQEYKKATECKDAFPSAMQGRIGGAKGMWVISGEPQSRKHEDQDIWIEVTDSQLKFEPPWEDRSDDSPYNRHRLTFNLLKYSYPPVPNDLHISFIPILVDRGVSRDVIARLMTDRLNDDREELLKIVCDPVKLHTEVTQNSAITNETGNIRWQAGLPVSLPEKVKLLLRSGVDPETSPFLASSFTKWLRYKQIWKEQKLRAPLGKATFMYGVTDSSGLLQPGEVHIQFSTPFANQYTGASYRNLNGLEVLLARQPACRRSDIQKVRVVCRPELSHLVDCVVFPTRGEFPLAGKLQGGDYDGDIFWTCWEDCLVEPFKNAPAPMAPLEPSNYGIKTDRRKLSEFLDATDLSNIDGLLKEAFKFKMSPSLLGKATNFLEKVAYQQNRIYSDKINALCDVHDLLVDAPKNGYSFNEKDYDTLVQRRLGCGNPKKPAYKAAMESNAKFKELDGSNQATIKHNPKNVLDYLFFDVFQAHNAETMKLVRAKLAKDDQDDLDEDLRFPYLELRKGASSTLKAELDSLVKSFNKVRNAWNSHFADKPAMTAEYYTKGIETCYEKFRALMPSAQHAHDPDIAPLLRTYLGRSHLVTWEYIRASALFYTFPKKHSFVWHMAGRELAQIKVRSRPDTVEMITAVWASHKPKPQKRLKPEDDYEEDGSDEDEMERAMERMTGRV